MKNERLFAAIGAADDDLLNRCKLSEKHHKLAHWRRWVTLAACLCIVLIGAAIFNNWLHGGRNLPAKGMVISEYETETSTTSIYATPECGTWFYFADVSAALKEYADTEVTYFLSFDIFSDNEAALTSESDEMIAELDRLADLGYEVGYIENWTYQGQGEQVYYDTVAGYFTAEQLENFPANPDYGYAFHFITNGDGAPVDARQGLITDYSFGDGISIQ